MKTLLISFIIVLNIGFSFSQGTLNIQVKDLNGNSTTIADITPSELIVLDFWATWCKPCLKSIPKLVELSQKFQNDKISFIGVSVDSPRSTNKIKPIVKSLKISYPIVSDPEQLLMTELMVNALPTLLVVNRKGKVLFIHEGFVAGDEIDIEKELNKIIEAK